MKKNLFLISEEEKGRILDMHKTATKLQYLSEQESATTPAAPAATTPAATENKVQTLFYNDKDYTYKKEGEKYFFKLQENPVSPKALANKQAGKFVNWTEAKGAGLEAIKKLDFTAEELTPLAPKKAEQVTMTTPTQGSQTTAAGGGGQKQIVDPIGDAKKLMPKIDTLDPVKSREVIAWSKTPSGQYVINTPSDQREAALDNLDRRKGDAETRRLKKEIRQALGMAADTLAGKIGSSIKGGVQGLKQGFAQQKT